MQTFYVRYVAGCYSGVRKVEAEDEATAIALVRASIRKQMTLPMYSDGYRVLFDREIEERLSDG